MTRELAPGALVFGERYAGWNPTWQIIQEAQPYIDVVSVQPYSAEFESFDALVNAHYWRLHTDLSNANETRDNVEFQKQVVDKYYATARHSSTRAQSHVLWRQAQREHRQCRYRASGD
jgi:hypothetical protein